MALLVEHILATRSRRVAVDGVDGAGKTIFASGLTRALENHGTTVVSVSIDDFHHRREVRYRQGKDSPEGYWLDSFDHDALRADAIEPLGTGGSGRYRTASHDLATDDLVDGGWQTAQPNTVLLVEGVFLLRDELLDCWDFSIFLDVPFEVTARRMAERDGSHSDPEHPSMRRYVEGQRIYLRECAPRERADVIIDNTDPAAPVVTGVAPRSSDWCSLVEHSRISRSGAGRGA